MAVIPNTLRYRLGSSEDARKRDARQIAELERQFAETKRQLSDWQEASRKAASEPCGDEKHCACVPLLRKQLAEALAFMADLPCDCHDEYGRPLCEPCDRCKILRKDGRKP